MKLIDKITYLYRGAELLSEDEALLRFSKEEIVSAKKGTIASKILDGHNSGDEENLEIKFDALCSHDITFVNIIQSARASGLTKFPVPYVLTNCHNSLCAVGGTINEDDHVFGLSAAKKYGGIYVPPHVAVIHQYMRERFAACGKMILGSDSHTRYGALGTMAIGEGGPELVKQILSRTYDVKRPQIVLVRLTGKVNHGVGPQDVAIKLIGETFKNGFVKNCVLEFVGEGVSSLSMDYRIGIDVMTTETACLSSIWRTDEKTREYLAVHGRENDYKCLEADELAAYDKAIDVDLAKIVPMIAMPFHPSNAYALSDVISNPFDVLSEVNKNVSEAMENKKIKISLTDKIKNGKLLVEQGIIAGCAGGTYENISLAANILSEKNVGCDEFTMSVYPSSLPVYSALSENKTLSRLIESGAVIKTAFCGPCFGAGDVPANNAFSIRHTTRNFPQREGSKPKENQIAYVALMDARSIAATAANKGVLTSAADMDYDEQYDKYKYNDNIYKNRIFEGYNKGNDEEKLVIGPNITDWPKIDALKENIVLVVSSVIKDAVTTTDELIPSGETSSFRSNPMRLAEFALSRKDPSYVSRAKAVKQSEDDFDYASVDAEFTKNNTNLGSVVCGIKVGDGSAREQAASCQRVLGGAANICVEYATKRYRSNLINWGMLPFRSEFTDFEDGDVIAIKGISDVVKNGDENVLAVLIRGNKRFTINLTLDKMTETERDMILCGCLMNYYKNK